MKVRIISRSQIERLISIGETIEFVEKAFEAKGLGKVQMPPKSYIFFRKYGGDFRVMPGYLEELKAAGVKVVNVHPKNPEKHNFPSVMATILLLGPENGAPLSVMDGTLITKMRTGAAAAVATKYLARKDSEIIAMIGAGVQARTQLEALNDVINIDEVRVEDIVPSKAKQYAQELGERLGLNIKPVDTTKGAVEGADIVVTVTPRRKPIVMDDWISSGTHINAIGADAPGKEELDPKILKRAKIVVDDWEQASHSGEINVPFSRGMLTRDDIYSDICSIVAQKKEGRISEEEITVFDSTGLAIQDIATAWRVYQKAEKENVGEEVELF
ncbi:alanine dehydrogenase [candidate division MSBL1 archaeon SCGC-AAA261F19]|uniref:Alanine dehydrogenase n=2 Tax=candidate division MSBL1 TaxID=215777 RepID=A0A133VA56_9EURY|nr:alanine dehydrogenase [candidate division MSBL1 archaeon SCGC-AAA261D19]KXB03323.1 alanine dehydrogenase [candidate division MSBL1 archaeon SCGC-AAA261F19]